MSRYERLRDDPQARLNPGFLRDRVAFYSRTVTKSSDTGADTPEWSVPFLVGVAAKMNPTGGHRFYAGERFNDETLETCTLRWQSGINATMQLEYNGLRYEILRVDDMYERRNKLMLALRRLV